MDITSASIPAMSNEVTVRDSTSRTDTDCCSGMLSGENTTEPDVGSAWNLAKNASSMKSTGGDRNSPVFGSMRRATIFPASSPSW